MKSTEFRQETSVRRVRFSLRLKLLLVLTLLPVVALALYLRLATNLFTEDKQAYVRDSGVALSRSLAAQVRMETDSIVGLVKPLVENFDSESKTFSPAAQDLFRRFPKLAGMAVCMLNGQEYESVATLGMPSSAGAGIFLSDVAKIKELCRDTARRELRLAPYPLVENSLVVGARIGQASDPRHLVVLAFSMVDTISAAFRHVTGYANLLVDENGEILFAPDQLAATGLAGIIQKKFFAPVLAMATPEGSLSTTTSEGHQVLVSYSRVGAAGLTVVSVVEKNVALKAVDAMVLRSFLFFIALISSTLIISVFASVKLTATLGDLYQATRKIAEGKFDVRIRANSNDELGGLADSFNVMAGKVSRLIVETAEKARMENELSTVRAVQETLFPPSEQKFGRVEVVGHFEPASECGGDWWNCSRVDGWVYIWIGDATGHGAPAALITSAARSAAAIIESLPDMSPARALNIMNQAIHETSKGKINMTFFLAAIEESSGRMLYANASHDPPFLIRRPAQGKLRKSDLIPLVDVNGLRLGEAKDSTYEQAEVQLEPGDSLMIYTDGVIDLRDGAGKAWGERAFTKTIIEAAKGGQSASEKMAYLRRSLTQHRGTAALIDDITMVMAEIKDAA